MAPSGNLPDIIVVVIVIRSRTIQQVVYCINCKLNRAASAIVFEQFLTTLCIGFVNKQINIHFYSEVHIVAQPNHFDN